VYFVLGVVVHLLVLYLPRAPSTGGVPVDKLMHALVFGGVLWLGARAAVPLLPLTVVLCVHAVVSELIQYALLSHRSADPWDSIADLAGVLIVTLLLRRQAARAATPG
jgi:hypothetical protein